MGEKKRKVVIQFVVVLCKNGLKNLGRIIQIEKQKKEKKKKVT